MAKRKKSKKLNYSMISTAAVLLSAAILISIQTFTQIDMGIPTWHQILGISQEETPSTQPEGEISVHFIDVGQGDCALIRCGDQNALIDAGENNQYDEVLAYLEKEGITRLDIVIGTHGHSDHIGGLDKVIDGMEVGRVILPDLPDKLVPTTKTYTDLLQSIANKDLSITAAKPGESYSLGTARMDILGPIGEYDDANDTSVVCRIVFGEVSFFFAGDATTKAEADLLASGRTLKSTVLKLSHHGSHTSNSMEFLQAIDPEYIAISVGEDTEYGHPHKEVMERVEELDVPVWQTVLNGNIVFTSDGKTVTDVKADR